MQSGQPPAIRYPPATAVGPRPAARVSGFGPPSAPKPKLLDRVFFFHGKRHPLEMGAPEVTAFLTALAVRDRVAASTQNQALNALLFLYRQILNVQFPWLDDIVRAKRPQHLPVVLTRDETQAVLEQLNGVSRLIALLLYGAGLRLLEACRLRVQDLDFAANQITIRDGKGHKDRLTLLPHAVKADLLRHLERVRTQHARDLRYGAGWVERACWRYWSA
jgi:integrase